MSLSDNYPAIRPTLLLDFARAGRLDPRITFGRSTTAVYYDGDTYTKAEENLALQSQTFDVTPWTTGTFFLTVTANSTAAPDGTTTAETITATAGTPVGFGPYIGYGTSGIATGVVVSASMYAKKNTHDFFQLWLWNQGANSYANFNLATGALGTAGTGVTNQTITAVGNGWYRCTMTFTTTTINCMVGAGIVASASATRLAVFSPVGTESIYIWGAQLEQRATVTAYTATTTQPITTYIPVLLTAPANTARFDHDPVTETALGLLIEEARTNAFTYSADFNNAAWPKTNVIVQNTAGIAPDGSQTLNKFIANTTNDLHFYYRGLGILANDSYSYSIYTKYGGLPKFLFYLNQAGGSVSTIVTFTNGVASVSVAGVSGSMYSAATSRVVDVGNGIYRIILSFTVTGSAGDNAAILLYAPDGITAGFAGNGFDGIYIWGAQLEAGAFATSYIATTTTTVTRTDDVADMTGVNFSSWYDPDQGTLFYDAKLIGGTPVAWNISDSTTANRITSNVRLGAATGSAGGVITGGVVQFNNSVPGTFGQNFNKGILAYANNDFASALNGQLSTPGTSGTVPAVTQANIGAAAGFARNSVLLSKIAYWPGRLTNAQLQTLTKS